MKTVEQYAEQIEGMLVKYPNASRSEVALSMIETVLDYELGGWQLTSINRIIKAARLAHSEPLKG